MAHTTDTNLAFSGASSPTTTSYTCGAGATVLVVGIVVQGAIDRVGGSPTFDGVAMTQANSNQKAASSPETITELWYMLAPPTGSAKTISIPNTGVAFLYCHASSYKSATGTSALDVTNGGNGTSANPSVSVTTTVDGDVVVASMGSGLSTVPTAQSGTLLSSTDRGALTDNHQYTLQSTAGAIAMSWTAASDDWGEVVAAFKETGGGGGEPALKGSTSLLMGV